MYKLFIKKNVNSKTMLNNILKKYHLNNDIFYNEFGKPYIKDNPIYFNISHSNNITVIAMSDKEIGIDIEHITYNKKIIDKICTEEEKLLINNAHGFTKLWVKKESYIKYLGTGLSYGLKNVDTNKLKFIIKKYKNYYISIYN